MGWSEEGFYELEHVSLEDTEMNNNGRLSSQIGLSSSIFSSKRIDVLISCSLNQDQGDLLSRSCTLDDLLSFNRGTEYFQYILPYTYSTCTSHSSHYLSSLLTSSTLICGGAFSPS